MLNLVFLGTPEFAAPVLESLAAAHRVSLVVTRPDRPRGRGRQLAPPPVKSKALELGLPVVQPESLKDAAFQDLIAAQRADVLVVVAFRILPATLFPLARFGAVNIHGSLLPKYRGAAPIQWAIANGETETGVTVFQLDAEVDHGRILAQARTPIGPEETAGDLFARLSAMGRDLLLRTLEDLEAGRASMETAREQDHAQASPAPKIRKEDGRIDWTRPAADIHNRVRAFNPQPGCHAVAEDGRVLRIHRTRVVPGFAGPPGSLSVEDGSPVAGTGLGGLRLEEVQWEGKPRISGRDLINGLRGGVDGLRFL